MNAGVIDTSALIKIVLPEEYSEKVRHLIVRHQSAAMKLMAPDYIVVECANVLWKHARRNELSVHEAAEGISLLRQAGIELVPFNELLDDAIQLAVSADITVYDALFAVLAGREGIPLITADRPLVGRLEDTDIRAIGLDDLPW